MYPLLNEVVVTGHSLGGAMANLIAENLIVDGVKDIKLITLG